MSYIFIKALAQPEGDIHLIDPNTWGVSMSIIKAIRIITNSTNWDLYLLQNDNGYVADDANIPALQIMQAGNLNALIFLDYPYQDEDNQDRVNLYYIDHSGVNTADIYVIGIDIEQVDNIFIDSQQIRLKAEYLEKICNNKLIKRGNQFILYDDDGTTILKTWTWSEGILPDLDGPLIRQKAT